MEGMIENENSEIVDDGGPPAKVLHGCPKCSRSFANIGHMKCHFYRVHPEFKLTEFVDMQPLKPGRVCRLCGSAFETQRALKQHNCPATDNTTTYLCAHCDRKFANKTSLQLHCMRTHRKDARHTCNVCQKAFATLIHLSNHMRVHAAKREESPESEEVYNMGEGISHSDGKGNGVEEKQKAEERDEALPGHTCTTCGQAFKTNRSLRSHLTTHATTSFPCNACDEEFSDQASLREHRSCTHPVEKTLRCDVCASSFATNRSLIVHMRVHNSAEKMSYPCDVCESSFSTKQVLKTHMKKHSSKARKFACAVCDKKFPLKCHLSRHLKKHN